MALRKLRLKRTTLIMGFCCGALGGLALAYTQVRIDPIWLVLIPCGLAIIGKKRWYSLIVVLVIGLMIGIWRGQQTRIRLNSFQALYGQKVVIEGVALEDGVYGDRGQLESRIGGIRLLEPEQREMIGSVRVRGFGLGSIRRGDRIRASAKLYPARGSNIASMSFAELDVLSRDYGRVETIRLNFAAGMQSALPEPAASLAIGLLVGQRNTLPDMNTDQLRRVGLSHIIAVSGFNLTILVLSVRRLLKHQSKYQTALAALMLIGLFLLITGLSASIVRASIVSVLALWAWYYGRNIKPVLLLLLPAAMTAMWNPLYIWRDIGWYLSFLAFFGVLVMAPLIRQRLYGKKEPKLLGGILLETLCAQIMTMPLTMFIFGEVSIIAPLANVLVVPLVPLAMLLSLFAGLVGMMLPLLAGWIALPARWVLTYIIDVSSFLSRPSWAHASAALSQGMLVAAYGLVIFIAIILWRRTRVPTEVVVE